MIELFIPHHSRRRAALVLLLGLLCLVGLAPGSARAAAGAWATSDHVAARLVSAVGGTGDLATVPVGLEIKLDGDWKTYWRSPGDAGLPPALDWAGSSNLASATLLYPTPRRITVLGIQTFGYKHEVVFPLDVKTASPGKPLDLKLKLDLLICAEQCIPQTLTLGLALPQGPARPDAEAQTLAKWRAALPGNARTTGIRLVDAQEVSDKGQPALEVKAHSELPFATPDIIPELTPDANLGPPRVKLSDDRRDAVFDLPLARKLPVGAKLAGRDLRVTVTDGARALDQSTAITKGASAVEEDPGPSLAAMILVALLGGLILNLMPCVLPVLSLKFFSVVSQGGRAPAVVRAGFLATAAGIVCSFLAIAGGLIALKAAGQTIGWGIQFQEPGFIAAMAVLVTVFACHLAGLFEMPLPRFVAKAAANRSGPDESLAGHFVTGAFATLLATPCSAPFLGTAVGFALAGSNAVMLAIFLALGVGLALPYLLVAAMPGLATRLPRPGRWMNRLKQGLGLLLAGTAVWLASVLASQAGLTAALATTVSLVAIIALLAGRRRVGETRAAALVVPAVAIVGMAAVVIPHVVADTERSATTRADEIIAWTSFDRDQIRSLVSQGKTVFVDVTADWCLTCQANKRFVLSTDAVARRLNSPTISMKADWTRPNPEIGAYLASYGRYGIPFNIVYGPAAPGGIVLPELLTTENVAEALTKASGLKASLAGSPNG